MRVLAKKWNLHCVTKENGRLNGKVFVDTFHQIIREGEAIIRVNRHSKRVSGLSEEAAAEQLQLCTGTPNGRLNETVLHLDGPLKLQTPG